LAPFDTVSRTNAVSPVSMSASAAHVADQLEAGAVIDAI
jgi:hypothetical protein